MAIQAKCSETALDCKITIKGDNERELIDSARKHFRTSHRLPDLGGDPKSVQTFLATSGGMTQKKYADIPTEDEWIEKVRSVITGG